MIHTGNIYLIDQSGKVNEVYSQDTKVEKIVHGIKELLDSN
jgi:cytochrome oxidase Cu insertion factor (SCO1/SenC/PrrC family)